MHIIVDSQTHTQDESIFIAILSFSYLCSYHPQWKKTFRKNKIKKSTSLNPLPFIRWLPFFFCQERKPIYKCLLCNCEPTLSHTRCEWVSMWPKNRIPNWIQLEIEANIRNEIPLNIGYGCNIVENRNIVAEALTAITESTAEATVECWSVHAMRCYVLYRIVIWIYVHESHPAFEFYGVGWFLSLHTVLIGFEENVPNFCIWYTYKESAMRNWKSLFIAECRFSVNRMSHYRE